MSSRKYFKCYFGCQKNNVLHRFPNPIHNEERFNLWIENLGTDVRERGPQYIYNNVRLCSEHFEPYFRTPSKKLTRNAIPTLNCERINDNKQSREGCAMEIGGHRSHSRSPASLLREHNYSEADSSLQPALSKEQGERLATAAGADTEQSQRAQLVEKPQDGEPVILNALLQYEYQINGLAENWDNEELATIKFERDKATAKLNDLQTVRKNQESLIHRLQKRLLLVTRERDSYRQQLEGYEKELTLTLSGNAGAGGVALLSARVEQLERALQGYRDLLATFDQETQLKALESARSEASKNREEAEAARREASKLRAQRDTLQAHLDRLAASAPETKILHLKDKPASIAQRQIQLDLEAAQEEIKQSKSALQKSGQSCSRQIQKLPQHEEKSRIKMQIMKEQFTSSAQEYRDVCYMLLGYKIYRAGRKNYRISNMYADSSDEYLTFNLRDDGIEMVHTEYSATLTDLVELYLHQHHSIPLFLSALTMELFTRITMKKDVLEC